MTAALVGLGSNLGDRTRILDTAVKWLAAHTCIEVQARSRCIETAPVGGPQGQPPFLNGATLLETSLSAKELFAALRYIEDKAARERSIPWGPRTLDLDLLLYGDEIIETPDLIVPHPRMAYRRFVVEPAAEIAPAWVHPQVGWALAKLREHLHAATPYVAIVAPPWVDKSPLARAAAEAVGGIYLADPAVAAYNSAAESEVKPTDPELAVRQLWTRELQFCELRASQLARVNWPYGTTPVISDYWIEQWADPRAQRIRAAISAPQEIVDQIIACAAEKAMRWKLLMVYGQRLKPGGDLGPILEIPEEHFEWALVELTAAIRAMESGS